MANPSGTLLLAALLALSSFAFPQTKAADVPRVIHYSGNIANVDGTPRTGTVGVSFSIYATQQGGAPLYEEVQNVTLDALGHYTVLLGVLRSEGLPEGLFSTNEARWLGIRVEGEQEQPRALLAAVPYALKAADAETLGGKPLSAFVLNESSGAMTSGGRAPTASGTADAKTGAHPMSISTTASTGTQNQVAKWTDNSGTLGNSVITDTGSGVGVNTVSPFFPLSVIEANDSRGGLLVGTDQSGNMFTIDSAVGGGLANLVGGAYWNGTTHVYGGARGASRIWLGDGEMHLYVGGTTGTAGNSVPWNELLTLSNAGNVGINSTSPQRLLEVGIPGQSANQIRISGGGPNGIEFMNYDGSNAMNLFFRTGLQNLQIENSSGPATPMMSFSLGSGNVGIGTNSPAQKLDVGGNINSSGNLTATGAVTANSFAGSGTGLTNVNAATLNGSPASAFAPASGSANYVAKAGDTMTGTLNLPSNGLVAGTNQLVLAGSSVGMGTASPSAKLDLEGGNAIFNGSGAITASDLPNRTLMLGLRPDNTSSSLGFQASTSLKGSLEYDGYGFHFNTWNNNAWNNYVLTLNPTGKVGIGTNSPDSNLTVSSSVPLPSGTWSNSGALLRLDNADATNGPFMVFTAASAPSVPWGVYRYGSNGSTATTANPVGTQANRFCIGVLGQNEPFCIAPGSGVGLLGNLQAGGTITGSAFYGDGSHLTGVTGSGLAAGTYSNAYTFSNASNSFSGSGSGLTNVNASMLNGLASSAFAPASGSTNYVAKTGDTMTGTLNVPSNGLVAGTNQLVLAGGSVGIGTATPSATLDVENGGAIINNGGTITSGDLIARTLMLGLRPDGYDSTLGFQASASDKGSIGYGTTGTGKAGFHFSVFNGSTSIDAVDIVPSGSVGIGTTAPGYKLDVQGGQINASGGLCINGTCQTSWPAGTVTSITAGAGLTGGTITTSGTVAVATAGITNAMIANPSVTVSAGTGLSGGGPVVLGGTVSLANSGVTSLTGGGGITVSGPSGSVTLGSTLGGDLTGTVASASLAALQGKPINITGLSTGQGLAYNGTQWVPSSFAAASGSSSYIQNAPASTQTGSINLTGSIAAASLVLPNTTTASSGVITFGGNTFLHNFGATGNTYLGLNAGNFIGGGLGYNTGIGYNTLTANTSGGNTAVGSSALSANTTGGGSAAVGYNALAVNTTGGANTALGYSPLSGNTTGSYNTATGYNALQLNTTGSNNTVLGYQAGYTTNSANANTTGSNNTFVGYDSGPGTSTQLTNATAIGSNAVVSANNSLVLGSINGVNGATSSAYVGIGTATPTTVLDVESTATTISHDNGSNGARIATLATSDTGNDYVHVHSGNGDLNAGIDSSGGAYLYSGNYLYFGPTGTNTLWVGSWGGGGNTNGRVGMQTSTPKNPLDIAGSVAIGGYGGMNAAPSNGLIVSGYVGIGTASPDANLSVNGTADKTGGGSWATFSDGRLKSVEGVFHAGLREVLQLRPIRYRYKTQNAMGITDYAEHIGFVAQEIQKIIPEAVTSNEKGYLLVNNDPILWTMLNAIKQQQAEIASLRQKVNELERSQPVPSPATSAEHDEIRSLRQQVEELRAFVSQMQNAQR